MKKFIAFALFALCIIGALGGVIVTIVSGAWPVAIGILGLAYTAWPEFKKLWYTLNFT